MRKIILLLSVLLAIFPIMAYKPMLVPGTVFEYATENPCAPGKTTYRSIRVGDSFIYKDNYRSKEVICILDNTTNDTIALMSEKDGIVVIADSGGNTYPGSYPWKSDLDKYFSLEPLYNLNHNAGESYTSLIISPRSEYEEIDECEILHKNTTIVVESVDSVLVGDKYAKRQTVYSATDGLGKRFHVVEGLGVTDSGQLHNISATPYTHEDYAHTWLAKATDPDGKVIYEYQPPRPKLLRDDRIWRYHKANLSWTYPANHTEYDCRFIGSETVNGKSYRRLCGTKARHWVEWAKDSISEPAIDTICYPLALMREENGKVYLLPASVKEGSPFPEKHFFPGGYKALGCQERTVRPDTVSPGSLPEILLYDFTLEPGGCWEITSNEPEQLIFSFVNDDYRRIDGETCREITTRHSYRLPDGKEYSSNGIQFTFTEGIGNIGEGNMTYANTEPEVDCDAGFERFTGIYDSEGQELYVMPSGLTLVNSRQTWEYYVYESHMFDGEGHAISKVNFQDTVEIDGKKYHQFVEEDETWWWVGYNKPDIDPTENKTGRTIALIREENGRLYARATANEHSGYILSCDKEDHGDSDVLLCDFNAATGAYIDGAGFLINGTFGGHLLGGGYLWRTKYIVSSTGHVNINGSRRKFVTLSTPGEYSRVVATYIEGIGCDNWVFMRPVLDMTSGFYLQIELLNGIYDASGNRIYGEWKYDAAKQGGIDSTVVNNRNITYEDGVLTGFGKDETVIRVFNSCGMLVGSSKGLGTASFATRSLSPGTYIASVSDGQHTHSLKFIVR